jgi:hypothetical protein
MRAWDVILGEITNIVSHFAYALIVNSSLALPESPITANAVRVRLAGTDKDRSKHEILTNNNITILRNDCRDRDCDRPSVQLKVLSQRMI